MLAALQRPITQCLDPTKEMKHKTILLSGLGPGLLRLFFRSLDFRYFSIVLKGSLELVYRYETWYMAADY